MIKRFGLWLLTAFFTFSVLAVAVSSSTNSVFGTPDSLKESLADSDAYNNAAEAIVDQAVQSMQQPPEGEAQPGDGDLQLDPKLTEKIARKVVTPDKLKVYAEQIVDGTYNWLEGDVEQPDYNIDISAIKKDLGNAVGDAAVERVEGLPVCTTQQLIQLQATASEFDPFNVQCRPPGINLQAERAKLVREVTTNEELLEDTKVTAEDTKSEETGRTPFENLAFVPTIFQLSQKLPWILGALGLIAGVGVIFLDENRRKAVRKLSIILLVSGVLLLVSIWLASALFGSIRFDGSVDDRMREAIVGIVRTLNAEFNRTLLVFAIIYAVIGLGGIIGLRVTHPKKATAESEPPEEKPSGHKTEDKIYKKPEPKADSGKNQKIQK